MKTKYVVKTPSGNWFETSLRRAVDTCIAEADVEGKRGLKGSAEELLHYMQEAGHGFDNYQVLTIEEWIQSLAYGESPANMTKRFTDDEVVMNLGGMPKTMMLRCLRCGHEWTPRTPEQPRICPSCKSPYWNKPRRS